MSSTGANVACSLYGRRHSVRGSDTAWHNTVQHGLQPPRQVAPRPWVPGATAAAPARCSAPGAQAGSFIRLITSSGAYLHKGLHKAWVLCDSRDHPVLGYPQAWLCGPAGYYLPAAAVGGVPE